MWLIALALLAGVLSGCTPSFSTRWQAKDALQAFAEAGLEAENAQALSPDALDEAAQAAQDGMQFLIPSVCVQGSPLLDTFSDCGGRILRFRSRQDLEKARAFYADLSQSGAPLSPWVYVRDNLLVQISGDLPEEEARRYEQALQSLQ